MPRNSSGVYSLPAGSTLVPNTLADPAVINATEQDIAADLNAPRPIVAGGTGASTVAGAQAALGLTTGTFGFLYGLTLSDNVADPTNSIDIASGVASEEQVSSPNLMTLPASISKSVSVAWTQGGSSGSPAGGLDTGTVTNGTYHVWLIQRSDTGVVDVLLSLSATSPTMPTNYNRKRRIGSIIRQSGAILPFIQVGDEFQLATPVVDVSVTNPGAAAVNRALSVPTGLILKANVIATLLNNGAAATANLNLTSPLVNNTISAFSITGVANTSGRPTQLSSTVSIITNTSAQIRANLNYSDANVSYSIVTLGWTDYRGRQF